MPVLIEMSSNQDTIVDTIQNNDDNGRTKFHATNGTFMLPAEKFEARAVAAFDYIHDHKSGENDAFLIAVNSDVSMQGIMDAKNAPPAERAGVESQLTRAMKIVAPLAARYPEKLIAVVFYDEPTPTPLYDRLAEEGVQLGTLHKHGYAVSADAPRIEGAHNFESVVAFTLPQNVTPVCYDLTDREDQSSMVQVVTLDGMTRPGGKPYIAASAGLKTAPVPDAPKLSL